jgi:hypothetical protein
LKVSALRFVSALARYLYRSLAALLLAAAVEA